MIPADSSNTAARYILHSNAVRGARVPPDRHPEARHQQQTRPSSGQGEEDGEARPAQDGPHPLLRPVHGGPLAGGVLAAPSKLILINIVNL